MTKVVLTDLVNLENQTTAVNAINSNNAVIEAAFDNTLSRDGATPNQMGANLDMNGNQLLNLPAPASTTSPLRVIDVADPAIVLTVPPVGTSGATVPLLNGNNTWSGIQSYAPGKLSLNGATSGSTVVNATAVASGTITVPAATDTLVARNTTDTLTNKTLTAPTINGTVGGTPTFNSPTINGTVGGAATFGAVTVNTPTISNPNITGTPNFTGSSNTWTATNAGLDIGNNGVVNTPFIDFHSSANNQDFDSRIIASGGAAGNGQGTLTVNASALIGTGRIVSQANNAGVGYSTGSGGSVTQATSKSTGVTLNNINGQITMNGAALAGGAGVGFVLTNNTISADDVVYVCIKSGASNQSYLIGVDQVSAGSCRIHLRNLSGGSLSEALVLQYVVIKGSIT